MPAPGRVRHCVTITESFFIPQTRFASIQIQMLTTLRPIIHQCLLRRCHSFPLLLIQYHLIYQCLNLEQTAAFFEKKIVFCIVRIAIFEAMGTETEMLVWLSWAVSPLVSPSRLVIGPGWVTWPRPGPWLVHTCPIVPVIVSSYLVHCWSRAASSSQQWHQWHSRDTAALLRAAVSSHYSCSIRAANEPSWSLKFHSHGEGPF